MQISLHYLVNGEDEEGNYDGVDVAQPHERRVQLVEMTLVDVVHEPLPPVQVLLSRFAGGVP